MSPINKFDTMPIGWPDPGQVQHHAPLGGSTDDGAEFGFETDAELRAANMVKALEQTVLGGGYLIVTASNAKALLDFMTNLNGAFAEALQIYKNSKEYVGRPGVTFNPLHEAAPLMLSTLKQIHAADLASLHELEAMGLGDVRSPENSKLIELTASTIAKAEGR